MPGYVLIMPIKQNLCTIISNPSGYIIVGERGRSNRALNVAVKQQNEDATTTPTRSETMYMTILESCLGL